MKNKIGVCDFAFPGGGLMGIEMAGQAGYQGLQIADSSGLAEGFPLLNSFVRNAYMETAAKYGLEFQGLNITTLCFANIMGSPLNSAQGDVIKMCLKNGVDVAKLMGIKTLMVNANNIHFISKPSPEVMKNITETFRYVSDLCKDEGIVISVETCIPAPMFHKLREEVGPNIKMCFDVGNPVYHGIGEPYKMISEYGLDCIDHFHIKDFRKGYFGYLTQDCEMCYPGEGDAGFDKCVQVIKGGGFTGWFISESIFTIPTLYEDNSCERDYIAAAKKDVAIMRKNFL